MEQVSAVVLQVHTLARGVGGDEDAEGVLLRVGVEGPLDLLAGVVAQPAPAAVLVEEVGRIRRLVPRPAC